MLAEEVSPDVRRSRGPDLRRRPARRHDELPPRLSLVRGVDRRARRRRDPGRRRAQRGDRRAVHGDGRRRRARVGAADRGVDDHRAGARPDRHGLSVQGRASRSIEYLRDAAARSCASTSGIRRPGAAALDLADVACGRFEAFWELSSRRGTSPPGCCSSRSGRDRDRSRRSALPVDHAGLVAGNPAMHAWLLERVRAGAA